MDHPEHLLHEAALAVRKAATHLQQLAEASRTLGRAGQFRQLRTRLLIVSTDMEEIRRDPKGPRGAP
jgi:hypothetical protein